MGFSVILNINRRWLITFHSINIAVQGPTLSSTFLNLLPFLNYTWHIPLSSFASLHPSINFITYWVKLMSYIYLIMPGWLEASTGVLVLLLTAWMKKIYFSFKQKNECFQPLLPVTGALFFLHSDWSILKLCQKALNGSDLSCERLGYERVQWNRLGYKRVACERTGHDFGA